MAENRYIGEYPAIGIRPCIDGRRGPLKVRESLEDQTMGMAKSVKKLFEEEYKRPVPLHFLRDRDADPMDEAIRKEFVYYR